MTAKDEKKEFIARNNKGERVGTVIMTQEQFNDLRRENTEPGEGWRTIAIPRDCSIRCTALVKKFDGSYAFLRVDLIAFFNGLPDRIHGTTFEGTSVKYKMDEEPFVLSYVYTPEEFNDV